LVTIPALLIAIYSFNATTFNQSFIRSSISAILIFLTVDIISIIFDKAYPFPLRGILFGLFHDIVGGIIFGYLIAISLSYLKRKLYDPSFGKRAVVIKYYNLVLTITIGCIIIYLLFFYRTYNDFSLIVKDYDLLNFHYYNKQNDKNVKVQIPISGTILHFENDLPFSFVWKYNDKKLNSKRTCMFISRFNFDKYGTVFKDKELFNKLFQNPTKEDIYEIFNIYYIGKINPGKISIKGNHSGVFAKELNGDKEIKVEMTLPYGELISLYKDMTKYPTITSEQKSINDKFFNNKVYSIIAAQNLEIQLKGIRVLLLFIVDIQKNRNELKEYEINLPIHDGVINIPIKEKNHIFSILGDNENDKDILIDNKNIGGAFGMEIDSHSLIYEIFKDQLVYDLAITNIKGKLNYMYKETTFKDNDNVIIYGEKLSINQLTHDALTVTGRSRNIVVNNEEMGSSIFSSLSGGIKILVDLLLLIITVLSLGFAPYRNYQKGERRKRRRK
jgi:hypothetical protein